MPNIGRPSKGCILCRKRRIKCDERKPGCLRCEKVNRECPGYLNPDTWLFRDESDAAATKRARKLIAEKKERNTTSQLKSGSDGSSSPWSSHRNGYDFEKVSPTRADTISPSLINDVEFRSICLFMESFTMKSTTNNDDLAYLDFLPHLYANTKEDSCLRKAISAVSQRNLVNRHNTPDLEKGATKKFSEALASTNRALADPEVACSDNAIATVYLLSLYELMTDLNVRRSWAVHVQGTLQLLRMRGTQQLSTNQGRQLFRLVHTPIMLKALMLGEEPPEESTQLVQAMQIVRPAAPTFPAAVALFFFKVTMLRAQVKKAIKMGHNASLSKSADSQTRRLLTRLIFQGHAVDKQNNFESRYSDDSHWRLRLTNEVAAPTKCESRVPRDKYFYPSVWVMGHWIKAWTARLYLCTTLLDALQQLHNSADDGSVADLRNHSHFVDYFEARLRDTAGEILGTVDYAFDDIDDTGKRKSFLTPPRLAEMGQTTSAVGPMHIFYGLGFIAESCVTTSEQKVVAEQALRRAGTERGLLQALDYIQSDRAQHHHRYLIR